MKLYDFLKEQKHDFDCWDSEYWDSEYYDCVVTVHYIEDSYGTFCAELYKYNTFCVELYKKVEVSNPKEFHGYKIDCKWSKLIEDNIHKFWNFSLDNWNSDSVAHYAENHDDFIIAWINELQYYVTGCVSEDFYDKLVQFVKTLKA